MQLLILVTLCFAFAARSSASQADPLAQVFKLLEGLVAKITHDGESEAASYKEFYEWCDSTSREKGFEIQTAEKNKATLEAAIIEASSDSDAASTRIEELASNIARDTKELKQASEMREQEASDFSSNEAALLDSIDTLSRAKAQLQKSSAAALLQATNVNVRGAVQTLRAVIEAASIGAADKNKLLSLVQASDDADDDSGAGDHGDQEKAGGVLDMLEDLKETAEDQLSNLREAEAKSSHNHNLMKQSLEDSISADNRASAEEKVNMAAADETQSQAKGELALTVKALDDATKVRTEAHADCIQTASDHEKSVLARTEELKTLAMARKTLKEAFDGGAASFLQVSARAHIKVTSGRLQDEVAGIVRQLARQHHSSLLSQLSARISVLLRFSVKSGADPFGKVRSMIEDMIAKLEKQGEAEASEKSYCDEQMSKTSAKKAELDEDVQKLSTKMDQAAGRSGKLKNEVTELNSELGLLVKSQGTMDRVRSEAHEGYVKATADLKMGIVGVRKALAVLREYYGSAGGSSSASASAALIQEAERDADGIGTLMRQPAVPEHGKSSGAGGSIMNILEVVENDMSRSLTEDEAEEADAEAEHQGITHENALSKVVKEQSIKYLTHKFTALDKTVSDLTSDLKTQNAELSSTIEYFTKVKGRCVAAPSTHEERAAKRNAEIKGLKNALEVLEHETAFLQRRRQRIRRQGRRFLQATQGDDDIDE